MPNAPTAIAVKMAPATAYRIRTAQFPRYNGGLPHIAPLKKVIEAQADTSIAIGALTPPQAPKELASEIDSPIEQAVDRNVAPKST